MDDTSLKLDTLRSAHDALQAVISALDGAGESLLAAQLSTTLDSIDLRLRRNGATPARA